MKIQRSASMPKPLKTVETPLFDPQLQAVAPDIYILYLTQTRKEINYLSFPQDDFQKELQEVTHPSKG